MTIIRNIQPADNPLMAKIIRSSLAEFGVDKPGTVYYDESTDHLFELFKQDKSVYYIAEQQVEIVGGAGIYPSSGLPAGVCELVKMYLKKEVRGKGLGKELIDRCLDYAGSAGYTMVYLETFPELVRAVSVYEKYGFQYLKEPLGNTGHYGCNVWMLKNL